MEQKRLIRYTVFIVIITSIAYLWVVFNRIFWQKSDQFPSESECFLNSNFSGQSLVWQVEYDSLGRIAKSIDPAGRPTNFKYSPLTKGQAQSITANPPEGRDITWQFDQDGLLASMMDGEGKVNYRYDKRKRLTAIERMGTPAISYGYDDAGRISELRVGDFYHIARTYDFLGRLSSINTPVGTIRYEYRPAEGLVIRSLPNGIKTFYRREGSGELKEITHGYFAEPNSSSYSVLASYSYEHRPDGKIRAISEKSAQGSFERRFDYDSMGRLIHATGAGGQKYTYEYDTFSNRVQASAEGEQPEQVCSYDWAGCLVTVNGDSTYYDTNGNLIEATVNNAKRTFRYHADGRVAEVQVDDAAAEYRYDGFSRLISRSGPTGQTSYIPDPLSGFWKPLVIDEGGSKTLVLWDGNIPLAIVREGKVEWLLHDHLGSVRMTADASGKIQETYDYDPFGVPLKKKNVSSPVPGFAGLFWDETAGGYLTLARLYDPHLGSFLQPDPQKRIPTADPNDLSLFAYCGGDPVNFVDLNGQKAFFYDNPEYGKYVNKNKNSLESDLISFKHDLLKSIVQNNIETLFADPTRKRIAFGNQIISYGDFLTDFAATINYEHEHPGDPFTDLKWAEIVISGLNIVTGGSTLGLVTPAIVANIKIIEIVGSNVRGRILLNRAENLASIGGIKLLGGTMIPDEEIDRFEGSFSLNEFGISLQGGYELGGTKQGWYRNPESRVWSKGMVNNLKTVRGTHITGAFSSEERRIERGGNPLNLYKPTSVTISRKKHEHYTEKMRGGLVMKSAQDISRKELLLSSPSPVGDAFLSENEIYKHDIHGLPNTEIDEDTDIRKSLSFGFNDDDDGGGGGVNSSSKTTVGGITLGGAGGLINGIGALKGVQVNENGNLILVGEDDKGIKLPPLRLDDLVTVFRSVYINGEGPTVTIDPNPENPEKSAMIIRHSAATDSTYVGWVLYQADRLMKGYGQGVDNITGKDIKSRISGYDKVIDTVYFDGVDPLQRQRGGVWERFWIVPAEATRFQSDRQKLTLFDVPLKVRTQKMKWVGNELVDDLSGKSSPGAKAFTSWFTKNYDGIAEEQYLKPPDETGIKETVPVFGELQRIALTTAIAERLRDQGVPMPFWMYDYEVRKIPFEKFTPGLEVKRQKREGSILRTARIFGGVELSADDKVVRTYSSNSSVSKVSPEQKAAINQNIRLANRLEKTVSDVVSPVAATPLAVKSIQQDKKTYKVTVVPGANTLALGPCLLSEPDIVVPLPGNRELHFIRQFNSFFSPRGLWGRGWTLDLPRLRKVRLPYSRESGKTSYVEAHVLLTPLNSVHAYFLDGKAVKNFSNPQSPAIDSNSPFRALTQAKPRFLSGGSTLMLLQKNGQEWYFTESGLLVASKDGPRVTVYEREKGKITRIVALHGDMRAGEIELEYKGERLSKATGTPLAFPSSKPLIVAYSYDDMGRLTEVATDEGRVGYKYQGSKVSRITWEKRDEDSKPLLVMEYKYDKRGRLLSEKDGSSTIVYKVTPQQKGIIFAASSSGMGGGDDEDRIGDKKHTKHAAGGGGDGGDGDGGDSTEVMMHYDQQMRPIKSVNPDGVGTTWSYRDSCNVEITITDKDKQSITVTNSLDERSRTIKVNGSPWIKAKFNEGGQLVGLSEFGQSMLHQEWRLDGQLRRITTGDRGTSFEYDENGLLTSIFLHPANAGGRFNEWQETKVDQLGRPIEVKDYRGLHVVLKYDKSGGIAAVLQQTPSGNGYQGFEIKRNENGRIDSVKSPWGNTSYRYGKDESIEEIIAERGGESASIKFSNSRVSEMTGFDGGRTVLSYLDDDPAKRLLASVKCPDGLDLRYSYSADGLLSTVDVENQRRVRLEYDDQGRVVAYALEPISQ